MAWYYEYGNRTSSYEKGRFLNAEKVVASQVKLYSVDLVSWLEK